MPLVHLSLNTECCYISLPLCHSLPSRSICLLFTSSSQLRNTVVGPKIPALLPKGEKLHCCKLHQCVISPPLQLSTPSSVKPFMKPIPRSSFLQLLLFSSHSTSFMFLRVILHLYPWSLYVKEHGTMGNDHHSD